MRKIFTFIVTAAFCLTGAAKTADEVITDLEKATGAQVIHFNKEMITAQMGKAKDKDLGMFENILNGCVLIIEDTDKVKTDRFNGLIGELDDAAYEPLVTVFDDDDRVKVLGRSEGETVKEIVIAVTDNEDCVMVYLKGDIPKDKISQIVNDKTMKF